MAAEVEADRVLSDGREKLLAVGGWSESVPWWGWTDTVMLWAERESQGGIGAWW